MINNNDTKLYKCTITWGFIEQKLVKTLSQQGTRLQTCALLSIDPADQLPAPRISDNIAIDSFLVCNSTTRARRWNVKLQVVFAETEKG